MQGVIGTCICAALVEPWEEDKINEVHVEEENVNLQSFFCFFFAPPL